jgi:glycosyltransferase involved in cell wall biosynthesis
MPLFSVIIPTYNSEKFIDATLQSVFSQTIQDFEILVIDDGSTDTTRSIVSKLAENDSRLQLITTENSGGPVTPTNIGIKHAQGKYVAFLDHDDTWNNNKLEAVLKKFQDDETIGFVLSDVEVFYKDSNQLHETVISRHNKKITTNDILAGNYFNTMSMVTIRRDILESIVGLDNNVSILIDYEIILRMLSKHIHPYFINEPLVIYTVHQNNTSAISRSREKRIKDLLYILEKNKGLFLRHKKILSSIYNKIGELYLSVNNKEMAVIYFKESIRCDRTDLLNYTRLLFAYCGKKPYRFMSQIKNKGML